LKGSFQKSNFKILPEYWNKLNNLAVDKNPGYQEIIEQIQKEPLSEGIRLEEELEEKLVTNLNILKSFGHDLELYVNPESKLSVDSSFVEATVVALTYFVAIEYERDT